MTTYNIKHIAKAYSDKDLDTLIAECQILAARLSNVVNYLDRDDGTIANFLNDTSDEVWKLARAAELSKDLKHGSRVYRLNGDWVSDREIEAQVDALHKATQCTYVEAVDRVFIQHGWSFEDRMAIGWA